MLYAEQHESGGYLLYLPREGFTLLEALPDRLRGLLEDPDFESRIVQRLFPVAYSDSEREAEYRRLLGDDLRQRKLEAIEMFEQVLARCRRRRRKALLQIPADCFEAFLGFVNDVRVMLGTELEITQDGWEAEVSLDHPRADDFFLLHFLSYVEEALLQATGMADLDLRPEDIR